MTLLVDVGYLSWNVCYGMQFGRDEWRDTDLLIDRGCKLCMDSRRSLRSEKYNWYKSNRNHLPAQTLILRKKAHKWVNQARERYPFDILEEDGLEADDVIALHYKTGDWIMTMDKDLAQLPDAVFIDRKLEHWTIERLQNKKKLKVNTPEHWLAYQLMFGDVADNIPRLLLSKDRETAKFIQAQEHPLDWLMGGILPEKRVWESLDCLIVPTPLYTGIDHYSFLANRYSF